VVGWAARVLSPTAVRAWTARPSQLDFGHPMFHVKHRWLSGYGMPASGHAE
jgi:hypothetical protein